jgi:hypothetical protein
MRLAAVLLVFKEQSFVEACVRSIYPVVDSICCATQYDRNLYGKEVTPDQTVATLLQSADPQNKLRLVLRRDLEGVYGQESESRLRNAAMALDPFADYYLIVDSDEIWPLEILEKAWSEVQKTRWAAYRVGSHCYFRKWNYRVLEAGEGYRPLVFLRRGFPFLNRRQVNWRVRARLGEYFRTGRKPKTVHFPADWKIHHGSGVGDDSRILTKLTNYSHSDQVDPKWFEEVWKNFSVDTKNFHYFQGTGQQYEGVQPIPTSQLSPEIRDRDWPEGWIEK